MTELIFQGALTLQTASPETEDGHWQLGIRFRDNQGVYTASDLKAGDVIILDTGFFDPGVLTRYRIESVTGASWDGNAQLRVLYLEDNLGQTRNPDLRWLVGVDGAVGRPSIQQGLLPTPSPRIQRLSDRFSSFVQNHNTFNIVDSLIGKVDGIGLVTLTLPVEEPGLIRLPSAPMGGLVHEIAILNLHSGAVIEVTGVKVESLGDDFVAWLETDDYTQFEHVLKDATITYMANVEDSALPLGDTLTVLDLDDFGASLSQTLPVRDLVAFNEKPVNNDELLQRVLKTRDLDAWETTPIRPVELSTLFQ